VSEATAHDLVSLLDLPPRRITVVLSGADLSRWSPEPHPGDGQARSKHGLGHLPYLVYVGGADWRKNVEGMLGALAMARRQAGAREIVLAWAGRLSPQERSRVLATARVLGVEPALRLLDFVSDAELAALYRGAIATVLVSRAEGFGYPVLEAMAAGCPVVASNCSSIAEVTADAALGVDPESVPAIAEAIAALGRSEAEHRRWRERGLVRAQHFSLERMGRETLAVYRQLAR
jgi:glycosyltransferase involved in cell wall biosynthesis